MSMTENGMAEQVKIEWEKCENQRSREECSLLAERTID